MYHAAPTGCRKSIERHGLASRRNATPGLTGTYLWERPEQALAYAAPLGDDVWIVACAVPLEFGGPSRSWLASGGHPIQFRRSACTAYCGSRAMRPRFDADAPVA
jgi:hypothetical protein